MQVIYIDSLFVLNFIIDYMLLLTTAKISSIEIKRRRLLLSAALGALYSVFMFFPAFSVLFSGLCKVLSAVLLSVTAFGYRSFGKTIRASLTLFLCSAVLAGTSVFFYHAFGGKANFRNGIPYISLSLKTLIFSALIGYIILTVIFRGRAKASATNDIVTLTLQCCGRSLSIRALIDTGCCLCDPTCGKPVIVCDLNSLLPLFEPDVCAVLCEYAKSSPIECMELLGGITDIRRFKIIPYRTVSNGSGVMLVFCPDSVELRGKGAISALIGISRTEICSEAGYTALIGAV